MQTNCHATMCPKKHLIQIHLSDWDATKFKGGTKTVFWGLRTTQKGILGLFVATFWSYCNLKFGGGPVNGYFGVRFFFRSG